MAKAPNPEFRASANRLSPTTITPALEEGVEDNDLGVEVLTQRRSALSNCRLQPEGRLVLGV